MLLFVRIKPNQKHDRVEKISNDWQIRLKAPAIDGLANEHLLSYLSKVLQIPKSSIILKRGNTSRMKYLEIDVSSDYVYEKLEKAALQS